MVRAEVPVTTSPDSIPERIMHDVTSLGLGGTVLASELSLPDGVEPAFKVDYAVARIAIPRGATVTDGAVVFTEDLEAEAAEAALAAGGAEGGDAEASDEAGEEAES